MWSHVSVSVSASSIAGVLEGGTPSNATTGSEYLVSISMLNLSSSAH